ncbi:MAG: hypothetical protein NPINA01_07120 [Nitrospinaceae bacterium]|nr:MAG: hypothetical protein NPINA01_07120 [Nitrospinaceae bacterium]
MLIAAASASFYIERASLTSMRVNVNRLLKDPERQIENRVFAQFINERFIEFSYWEHPWTGKFNLNRGTGFKSTTIYMKHASQHPAPVFVSPKSGVILKNDHEDSLQDISLCHVDSNEEVFSLKKLPHNKSIRLGFVRSGSYRLLYRLLESGHENAASVDIFVR